MMPGPQKGFDRAPNAVKWCGICKKALRRAAGYLTELGSTERKPLCLPCKRGR